MKTTIVQKLKTITWIILAISLTLTQATRLQAQSGFNQLTAQPVQQDDNPEKITLELLGFSNRTLRGESQTTRYNLNLPDEWELKAGGKINLQVNIMFNTVSGSDQRASSILEIFFNDVLLEQMALTQSGETQLALAIPASALVSNRDDDRHQLAVHVLNEFYCETGAGARVVVKATSELTLPHDVGEPSTDLTKLPLPIYQPSFVPSQALLVVPTNPTSKELAAALTVAATFGHLSNGKIALSLTPEAELSTALRNNNHLIFVGLADNFSAKAELDKVNLPANWQNGLWEIAALSEGDGLIQMAVSPWQETKVILVVSGQTDTAVTKAAQAIGTGSVRVSSRPDMVIVKKTDINVVDTTNELPRLNQTLADAGIGIQTFDSERNDGPLLTFSVPANYVATSDAYFELFYTHSALVNYERSGLAVTLNDELIGSVRFTEESTSLASVQIVLPHTAIRTGQNQLAFESRLEPISSDCRRFTDAGVWLSIRPESTLHLPLAPGEISRVNTLKLNKYPQPFTAEWPFTETALIVPAGNAIAHKVATTMISQMGKDIPLPIAIPTVLYADAVKPEMIKEQDLLIIGQPKSLPVIDELADYLPVPFLPRSNLLNENRLPVTIQISANNNVAYLELLPAPWDEGRTILAVLGNTDDAVSLAGSALTDPDIREQLGGNFALLDDNQLAMSTIQPQSTNEILSTESAIEGDLPAALKQSVYKPPSWILPILSGSIILMVLIAIYVAIAATRRRHT